METISIALVNRGDSHHKRKKKQKKIKTKNYNTITKLKIYTTIQHYNRELELIHKNLDKIYAKVIST